MGDLDKSFYIYLNLNFLCTRNERVGISSTRDSVLSTKDNCEDMLAFSLRILLLREY